MKKVLLISYYWPPAGGPGVQRILKFVKYLPQLGWVPVILTVENGDPPAFDESLLNSIPGDCKVYKTPIIEPYNLYRYFTGRASKEKLPTYILNPRAGESLKDKFARWVRANIFIPDARIGWIPYALKAGKKIIDAEGIDLIYSSSPPHTVQLIAKKLAKKSQKKWVADFRDPWTEAFWYCEIRRNVIARRLDLNLEKSVLKHADALTTVSDGIGELLASKVHRRYAVIQNGLEPLEIRRVKTKKFMILFIGHLSKHQNPQDFFEAVEILSDDIKKELEIIFVGRIFEGFPEIFQRYGDLNIIVKDYMPYKKLMDFARQASLFLRPIAKSAYSDKTVGAKTYDYLALRKPILTLGKKNSVSEQILRETQSGELFEYNDHQGIANYIKKYYEKWKRDKFILLENEDNLIKYTTESNVKKLVEIFEETIQSH